MNRRTHRWGGCCCGVLLTLAAEVVWAANGQIKIGQRNIPLTITNGGSYVLTESVTNGSGSAITITADQVTLDLSGYTLKGTRTSFSTGISTYEGVTGLRVRNGHVENFGRYAVGLGDFGRMERVTISGCGQSVNAGEGCLILDCQAYSNVTGDIGIPLDMGDGTIVQDFLCSDMVSRQPFSSLVESDDGCLLSRLHITRLSTTGTCWVVQAGAGSLLADSSVTDCRTRDGSLAGVRILIGTLAVDSIVRGITAVNGSAHGGSSSLGSMWLRCQVGGVTSSAVTRGLQNYTGSCVSDCLVSDVAGTGVEMDLMGRVVRTVSAGHTGLGFEVVRGGAILRENQSSRTTSWGFYTRGFTSLLLLNASLRSGSGFSDYIGQTNHRALVVSSPGMYYEMRSNTWANIKY